MKKIISNKRFVIEVAKIIQNDSIFEGDISKDAILERLREKYSKPKKCIATKKCTECGSRPGYHTLDCTVGRFGGSHPSL